ncbi:hypothetical protein Tco_1428633 [Tanacetum coccineum]
MNELVNDGIKLSKVEINIGFINGLPKKWLSFCQSLRNTNHVKDSELASLFDCWSKTSVPSYQSPFQPKLLHSSEHKLELRRTKYFEAKYNKVKAKLALLSSSALAPSSSSGKNNGLITKTYDWDKEEVSSDDNEVTKVKALMVHTLLKMEDNNNRKSLKDYFCIDLNYVEEQRNNLLSKHRNLVHELNTCKEQLLVLKQAKLDLLTMQHVNTEILIENQNLRNKLKELTSIIEAWLNSTNKVNQYISEQIPTQKRKILGIDQLTEDTSSSRPKDPVFVKSLADNSEVSITSSNKHKLSETEDSTLLNHDTGKVPSNESQRNITDHSAVVSDSLTTDYDSVDESSVCSTPLPPLENLTGAKPVFGPKTIKSILKSKSTFKAKTLKGIIINEPSSALARGNKSSLVSKSNSALAGKLKNVKIEDDPPFAIIMKELNELKLQISKNKSPYFRNKNSQQIPSNALKNKYKTQFKMNRELYDHDTHGHNRIISLRRGIKPRNPQHITKNCETCGSNVHTTSDHNDIKWFRKREANQAKKAESFKASKTESSNALRSKTPTKSKVVNESQYRGIIGPLMNLAASRPNIQFSTAYARHQANMRNPTLFLLRIFSANKQQSEAMFSTDAEDIADAGCYAIILWIKSISIQLLGEVNEAKALEKSKVSFLIPTGGIFREVGVNTFRNDIGAHYLPHSSEYVAPPSIDVVRQWFPMIGYGEEHEEGDTMGKVVPHTRFLSLLIMHKMKEGYGDDEISQWRLKLPSPLPMFRGFPKAQSLELNLDTRSILLLHNLLCPAKRQQKRHQHSILVATNIVRGVTSEARANPQLSSGMSAFNLNEPIYSTSFIIHSESALGNDASAASIAEADLGNFAPSDFVPQQQGASSVASQIEEETSNTIKLKDLAKLVSHVQPSFKDLDSPEDDPVIVVNDSDEDEDDEVDATKNYQKYKLELEKNKDKAEASLLKAQPSFSNVEQLKELLVNSLKTKFSNILSTHDFSSSLSTELKDLPSKFNDLTEEIKWLKNQVHNMEIKLLGELKEIPPQAGRFYKDFEMVQAKLKTLDALPSLLNKVTNDLN